MAYVLESRISDALMRSAASHCFRRGILKRWWVYTAVILIAPMLPEALVNHRLSVDLIMAGALLAAIAAVLVHRFYLLRRKALAWTAKLENRQVRYVFDDAGFHVHSPTGSNDIAWKLLEEVVRFDDLWLFFLTRYTYIVVPGEGMTADMKIFIEQKLTGQEVRLS
ncbi:MAG: YcxB family protein [Planctomycetes bacterium]|nr:YcxB family protein [Planctomycetota bacterium]